jgi:hypothetical protein
MANNEPTRDGWELGFHLAKFVDAAKLKADRCVTCAFRSGTYANGCETTVMDALKCVMERVPFQCHEENKLCGGYVSLCAETPTKTEMPWPFSDESGDIGRKPEEGGAN